MKKDLKLFTKIWLSDNCAKLPYQWQNTFKLMYGRNDGKRSVNDALLMDIDDVIAEMNDSKIKCGTRQVVASLEKLNRILVGFGYPPKIFKKLRG